MSVQRIVEDAPPIDLQAEAQHTSGEVEEPVSKHMRLNLEPGTGQKQVKMVCLTWIQHLLRLQVCGVCECH